MEKYIEDVKACKKTVAWIVPLSEIDTIVNAVKAKCSGGFTHSVSMDWDDENLYWLRFTRVSSSEQPTAVVKTVQTAPSAMGTAQKPETKKQPDPPRVRYGGPRW
jgi:hypothetical protein